MPVRQVRALGVVVLENSAKVLPRRVVHRRFLQMILARDDNLLVFLPILVPLFHCISMCVRYATKIALVDA